MPVPKTLASPSPDDILYEAPREKRFRMFSLPRPGTNRHSSCSCPIRLAAGNADSVIGKIHIAVAVKRIDI